MAEMTSSERRKKRLDFFFLFIFLFFPNSKLTNLMSKRKKRSAAATAASSSEFVLHYNLPFLHLKKGPFLDLVDCCAQLLHALTYPLSQAYAVIGTIRK